MGAEIRCPTCGKTETVGKVSTIYLVGIGLVRKEAGKQTVLEPGSTLQTARREVEPPDWLKRLTVAEQRQLSKRLAPPAAGTSGLTRPIHPDWVIGAATLIVPVFLVGIVKSQPGMLVPLLAILGLFYAIYFYLRIGLVKRFARQEAQRQTAAEHARQGIERWMRLFYCVEDDGLFEPGQGGLVPAEQIAGVLHTRDSSQTDDPAL